MIKDRSFLPTTTTTSLNVRKIYAQLNIHDAGMSSSFLSKLFVAKPSARHHLRCGFDSIACPTNLVIFFNFTADFCSLLLLLLPVAMRIYYSRLFNNVNAS